MYKGTTPLLKKLITKSFCLSMANELELQYLLAYMQSVVKHFLLPSNRILRIKPKLVNKLNIFICKLLDLLMALHEDFSEEDRIRVRNLHNALENGTTLLGHLEQMREDPRLIIQWWDNLLHRDEVLNHFFADTTDSEHDTGSSDGSSPKASSSVQSPPAPDVQL